MQNTASKKSVIDPLQDAIESIHKMENLNEKKMNKIISDLSWKRNP